MPSSLQYKKIYIDSKFRTSDSNSSSDFKYELPETVSFHENTVFSLNKRVSGSSYLKSLDELLSDVLNLESMYIFLYGKDDGIIYIYIY